MVFIDHTDAPVPNGHRTRGRGGAAVGFAACALALAAMLAPAAGASRAATHVRVKPVKLIVLSPHNGDRADQDGAGFVVDLSLTARNRRANTLLSPEAGYKRYFDNPTAASFHVGANEGAPGLVVMLSTTPDIPGTPLQGPRTNLAGLFQVSGVTAQRGLIQIRNAWHMGRAGFGSGRATLTAYAIVGTAPAVVARTPAAGGMLLISNVVKVPFTIDTPMTPVSSGPTR
jgi:hypothetical protein